MSAKTDAAELMGHLGCDPLVSAGLFAGETFCVKHGQANDPCYGWSRHGCTFAYKVVVATRNRDYKRLGKLLRWASA